MDGRASMAHGDTSQVEAQLFSHLGEDERVRSVCVYRTDLICKIATEGIETECAIVICDADIPAKADNGIIALTGECRLFGVQLVTIEEGAETIGR